jgi:predicted component of type VI protein secretion system
VVVAPEGEYELKNGAMILGRDPNANIVLADPLVSRFHARIAVESDGQVVLEDLQSTNGLFVNGVRLSRPSVVLTEGDRLLLGTIEISVFSWRGNATTGKAASIVPQCIPAMTARNNDPSVVAPRHPVATTGRADPSNLVGQFAEQLMASGHVLEAEQALSEHLQNLLKGAAAGLSVSTRVLDTATHYALLLHRWTSRSSWLDYVLELHLAGMLVPSNASLDELETAFSATAHWDLSLVAYFVKTLERRSTPLTTDETLRIRRVEHLGRPRTSKPPSPSEPT